MEPIDRRKFLGLVGAGSAAAAATTIPVVSLLTQPGGHALSFRAEGGLPAKPLAAYATAVVEGNVNLEKGTGTVATRLLAGHPGDLSDIALPGATRVVRVTRASTHGSEVHIEGVVEDRSLLARGETAQVSMVVDRRRRVLHTSMAGHAVTLGLR
jgi:hypothetical protein